MRSSLITLVIMVAIWEISARAGAVFLPSLTEIGAAYVDLLGRGVLRDSFFHSFRLLCVGFLLAAITGILTGLFMGLSRQVERMLNLYVNLFLVTPLTALVPVFVVLFGTGSTTILVTIFIFSFFPIVINVYTGVKYANANLLEMCRSFGGTRLQAIRKIILPCSLPLSLAGIRVGATRAIKGMVIGEMLVTIVGMGSLVKRYGGGFNLSYLYAVIMTLIVFSLLINFGIRMLESRFTRQFSMEGMK